jgi:trehalose utilization protein
MAWAFDRSDGGRSFGFTGGHYHRNWADDDIRKLVLNAIAWTANVDVPKKGIESSTPSREEMKANLDKKN